MAAATEQWVEVGRAHLAARRYAATSFERYRAVVRRFLAFLRRHRVEITVARTAHVDLFLATERRRYRRRHGRDPAGGWRTHHTASIHLLFRLAQGCWPPLEPPPSSAHEQFRRDLREGYRRWLTDLRGLSELTFIKDWGTANLFLQWLDARASAEGLRQLTPSDLDAFLAWRMAGLRRATRAGVCQGLRSFLRYLRGAGYLDRDLAAGVSRPSRYERLKVGRVLAGALQRIDSAVTAPAHDPLLKRVVLRQHRRPHIFSSEEIACLFRTARDFPSPHASLRPQTLRTMLVLGYCAGLRIGEIVRLELRDVQLQDGTLEIRETKFFKSRRLPLRPSAALALHDYLAARRRAGCPERSDAPLFCHEKGGYAYVTAECLLRRVVRAAGLKTEPGRRGPRIHDLRHTFVVHRMLEWYRQGINPQARLPYLATYLGHRDIHSTLVYLTITQELMGLANERFRTLGASLLAAPQGESHVRDAVAAATVAGVLSQLAGPPTRRFRPYRSRLPRQLATVPAAGGDAPAAQGRRSRVR